MNYKTFILLLLLMGCAQTTPFDWSQIPSLGFTKEYIKTPLFTLTAFQKKQGISKPLVVYLEGDGHAWVTRSKPSNNPTPLNPLSFKLAAQDPRENVVYLGRPCHYTDKSLNPACYDHAWWTSKRFAPEVVDSIDFAITKLKASPEQKVEIIGHSGGAAIAILVAAKRNDISALRTIAGNLDTDGINSYHKVSATPKSLNPADFAQKIARVPQVHYIGEKDRVVPAFISYGFEKKQDFKGCTRIEKVKNASHATGWNDAWPRLLEIMPQCGN